MPGKLGHGDMMPYTHFFPGHLRQVRDQVKVGSLNPAEGRFEIMPGVIVKTLRTVDMPYQWGPKESCLLSALGDLTERCQAKVFISSHSTLAGQ